MITLKDVAYVAYQVPDLSVTESFLVDFGMQVSAREKDAIYFRGAGTPHYIYVARLGPYPKFLGAGFIVQSLQDLENAAQIENASQIENINEPGGGQRVTLTTPSGHTIWLEHGSDMLPPLETRDIYPLNFYETPNRKNISVRQQAHSVPVLRFGHFVLQVPNAAIETDWFLQHFNLTPSDYMGQNDGQEPVIWGAFLRFDRGVQFVDHHCLLISESKMFGCHHSSFEVSDLDAVMAGHNFLESKGYELDAGVGRHLLGSLVYDYWRDPFGQRIEHFTDPDIVNEDFIPQYFSGSAEETTQWGMAPAPDFFD